MLGYSEMTEVAVWVQTNEPAHVQLQYSEIGSGQSLYSQTVKTRLSDANTAILKAVDLSPGRRYNYSILVDGVKQEAVNNQQFQSQKLWQWREDPPEFRFVAGSCSYINEEAVDRPGNPYGGGYEIFSSIADEEADLMVWLGDNTYLRETDWNSMSGILHRNTHTRSLPEMQELLADTHQYAIWDDHDFGPNDSDRSYFLKDSTLHAFELFWANPSYGINGKSGITTKFQWNDCEFFALDNRYYRSPNKRTTGDREVFGKEQIQWLVDNLASSNASFKFVCVGGQVVNSAAVWENYATYEEERAYMLNLIKEEGIKNVVFLSGDRHHSELSIISKEGSPSIYDITSSPLTSGSHPARDEGNIYQIENSLIHERNYAVMDVSGPWGERILDLSFKDKQGNKLWSYRIEQQ